MFLCVCTYTRFNLPSVWLICARWTRGDLPLSAEWWCHWLWRITLTTGVSMLMTHELQGCVSHDWHSNPHYFGIISQPFLSKMSFPPHKGLLTVLFRYWWISPLDPGAVLVKMSAAVNSLRKMKRMWSESGRWGEEATTQIHYTGEPCCLRFFPQMPHLDKDSCIQKQMRHESDTYSFRY